VSATVVVRDTGAKVEEHRAYDCAPPIGSAAKLDTAWRGYESWRNIDIAGGCDERQHQLSSAQHLGTLHYGVEICVWTGAEGAEVLVLPD
jgi:hypothetical protein